MTARKRKSAREPLLNTVARKLGHAAGTFAKATQELTENLSAIPENVTAKVRESTRADAPVRRLRVRSRHAKKRIRHIARKRATVGSKSRKSPKSKSTRNGPKASSSKK
jgi:hypothetical protein